MGLFDKKSKETEEDVVIAKTPEELKKEKAVKESSFVMGVEKILPGVDEGEIVLYGKMDGAAARDTTVFVCNPGSDNDTVRQVRVLGIFEGNNLVMTSQGGPVGVVVAAPIGTKFQIGDVVYTEDVTLESKVHSYVKALTNTYVVERGLALSKEEVEALSTTDVEEIWRFYGWFTREIEKDPSEEKKAEQAAKLSLVCTTLCNKIFEADHIYAVFSKYTGEPYMFSRTIANEDGSYMCTAPNIRIFTEAYKERMEELFGDEKYVIQKIDNGEDKKGIYNFLGIAFYINGAEGVEIISEDTVITAVSLVAPPDYSNIPKNSVPVTNPNLVRWMLLLGQMIRVETDDQKMIYRIYYRFLAKEMLKAKFLVPVHSDGPIPAASEEGRVTVSAGMTVGLPVIEGKDGQKALRIFTDWRHLYQVFPDKSGNAAVETLDSLISSFECVINLGRFPAAGRYVTLANFNEMEEIVRKEDEKQA